MKMRVFSYEKSIFLFSYLPIGRPNEKKTSNLFLEKYLQRSRPWNKYWALFTIFCSSS